MYNGFGSISSLEALAAAASASSAKSAREVVAGVEIEWLKAKDPKTVLQSAERVHFSQVAATADMGLIELAKHPEFKKAFGSRLYNGPGAFANEVQRTLHASAQELGDAALASGAQVVSTQIKPLIDSVTTTFGGVERAVLSSLNEASGGIQAAAGQAVKPLVDAGSAAFTATGAALGSFAPVVGTILGALGGLLLKTFFGWLFSPEKPLDKDLYNWETNTDGDCQAKTAYAACNQYAAGTPQGCYDFSQIYQNRIRFQRLSATEFGSELIIASRRDVCYVGLNQGGTVVPKTDVFLVPDSPKDPQYTYSNPGGNPSKGYVAWLYGGWSVDQGPRRFPYYPHYLKDYLAKFSVPADAIKLLWSIYVKAAYQPQDVAYKCWLEFDGILRQWVAETTRAAVNWVWWMMPLQSDWGQENKISDLAYDIGGLAAALWVPPPPAVYQYVPPGLSTTTKVAIGAGLVVVAGAAAYLID